MLVFESEPEASGLMVYGAFKKRAHNRLTKAYCPARIGMTLETLDVKLHFFFFSWTAPTFCFETIVFIR